MADPVNQAVRLSGLIKPCGGMKSTPHPFEQHLYLVLTQIKKFQVIKLNWLLSV
jgi:hypothetical protein